MKRIITSITVVALFAIVFSLALAFSGGSSKQQLVPTVQAQEVERTADPEKATALSSHRGCSLRSIAGRYGWMIQGTALPPYQPVPTQAVAVGTIEVDAHGNMTGSDWINLGAQVFPRTYKGTITVNSDCTFTCNFTFDSSPLAGLTVHTTGVIVGNSSELQFVETDPGLIFTAVAKRM